MAGLIYVELGTFQVPLSAFKNPTIFTDSPIRWGVLGSLVYRTRHREVKSLVPKHKQNQTVRQPGLQAPVFTTSSFKSLSHSSSSTLSPQHAPVSSGLPHNRTLKSATLQLSFPLSRLWSPPVVASSGFLRAQHLKCLAVLAS